MGDSHRKNQRRGFTLIELSIVLVVIGLIVGGVLVGRDLIKAAEVRAQVTQIEKYNQAVNAFRGKFGGIPGDFNAAAATQYGFIARAGTQGRGDGNGLIEPWSYVINASSLQWPFNGEPALFWADLSSAGLIDQTFNTAQDAEPAGGGVLYLPGLSWQTYITQYVPYPKGFSNGLLFVYSYSGNNYYAESGYLVQNGTIYAVDNNGHVYTAPGITVAQAYRIDSKIDDGLPLQGNVQATYLGAAGNTPQGAPNAATDNTTTCYNTATTAGAYSITFNNGVNPNCALSFKFQ